MKKKDLKSSEDKQVIIATYAMAEEALDIKSLTTLMMTTPKTSISVLTGALANGTMSPTSLQQIIGARGPLRIDSLIRQIRRITQLII